MATCKECLYFKRCVVLGVELDMKHNKEADKNCRHFENKANYAEVRHGEWVKTDRGIRVNVNTGEPMRAYTCDCSCCGWHTGHQGIDFNYCPNCGARMDGRSEQNALGRSIEDKAELDSRASEE